MTINRSYTVGAFSRAADTGADLVVEMAFASATPYERWWGIEVLDVAGARLARLNDGAPLLFNHNWDDVRGVHVAGSVRADSDGVLRGKVRITSATQNGRDAIGLVESGILSKSSVGYTIHKIVELSTDKSGKSVEREIDGPAFERLVQTHQQTRDGRSNGGDLAAFRRDLDASIGSLERASDSTSTYKVTDWEPMENSLVTVPADPSVGIGRSAEQPTPAAPAPQVSIPVASATSSRSATMAEVQTTAATQVAAPIIQVTTDYSNAPSALDIEKGRRKAVQELAKANNIDSRTEERWVMEGTRLETVATQILEIIEERGKTKPSSAAELGLSRGEQQRYSMFRVMRMLSARNPTESQAAVAEAAYEIECSRAVAKSLGRQPDGIFVPADILRRPVQNATRAMTSQPGSAGGYLVDTDNLGFIDILRNRSVLSQMGARTLSGLQGNVTIPRQTGAGTLVWQAGETTAATAADQVIGQLSMTPKTAIAVTEVGRTLMMQSSPSAESMVTSDLARVVALGVDLAGLTGTGGAQPIGIENTTGITSGQTATNATYALMLAFQGVAAGYNAILGGAGYVTTPAVAAILMAKSRFANTDTPLWDGSINDGMLCGMRAMSSNQVTAGHCIFGSWNELVIGEWGVLELTMNPYQSFNAGVVGIRAIYTVDVLVRYPAAFVVSSSVTT